MVAPVQGYLPVDINGEINPWDEIMIEWMRMGPDLWELTINDSSTPMEGFIEVTWIDPSDSE